MPPTPESITIKRMVTEIVRRATGLPCALCGYRDDGAGGGDGGIIGRDVARVATSFVGTVKRSDAGGPRDGMHLVEGIMPVVLFVSSS